MAQEGLGLNSHLNLRSTLDSHPHLNHRSILNSHPHLNHRSTLDSHPHLNHRSTLDSHPHLHSHPNLRSTLNNLQVIIIKMFNSVERIINTYFKNRSYAMVRESHKRHNQHLHLSDWPHCSDI